MSFSVTALILCALVVVLLIARAIYLYWTYPALEFAILTALQHGGMKGRDLRELLKIQGRHVALFRFYVIMSDLETQGFVYGTTRSEMVEGHSDRYRSYRLQMKGQKRIEELSYARSTS